MKWTKIHLRNISKNPSLQSGTKAMHGIRPLACRRLMDWRHQNIWCIPLSGISRRDFLWRGYALLQTYYEENPTRDASDRTEEADKVSARIATLLSERLSALHRMSIFPFIESCLPVSIPTPDAFEIITSRRRNGCWTEQLYFMEVPLSFGRH